MKKWHNNIHNTYSYMVFALTPKITNDKEKAVQLIYVSKDIMSRQQYSTSRLL